MEDFIHLRLDHEKHHIAVSGLYGFKKGRKRPDTGGRNIVQVAALEDKPDKTRLNSLLNPFLEKVRVISINISVEVQYQAVFRIIRFLEHYFEIIIFFVVESEYNIIITHSCFL